MTQETALLGSFMVGKRTEKEPKNHWDEAKLVLEIVRSLMDKELWR